MDKCQFQRLPTLITPLNYQISLTPDLTKLTFDGVEIIKLKVNQSTDEIVLNSKQLNIDSNEAKSFVLLPKENKVISIKKIDLNVENEIARIQLAESLISGSDAHLQLSFNGQINDKLHGFYLSKYTGPDGKERRSAVTQFEATYARQAFPCWDEPAHKATFDIILKVPNDGKTKALSNMPVKEEVVDQENCRVFKYDQTPIMSTYLVAFVVGEYDYIETRSKHDVLIRVYTPIGQSEKGRFALEVAAGALDFFTDYFQIPYPLAKLDLIAISDFSCGAMENWGLVTYREACILIDEANSSTQIKQKVSIVVAHELAHQWFGNLVTMEWWTHLWLNEGFATFAEHLCVANLFPQFDIWTQFVSNEYFEAMELDSLENSHPIEVPVGHPSEVDQIFDSISYSKGASIIYMLYQYMGDNDFRKGMNLYLLRHKYKNTQTEDLWDALEEVCHKPIRRMMSTWTKQKGYPVLSIKIDNNQLELSQEKFNSNGIVSESDSKLLWANPILIITASSQNKPVIETLMENKTLTLDLVTDNEWFKLNPSSVATYRVNYGQFIFRLLKGVHEQTLKPLDRLNLLDDLFALTLAGRNSSVNLMKTLEYFQNESNYSVWSMINTILRKYTQLLYNSDYFKQFVELGTKLASKAYQDIGWAPKSPQEHHLTILLRSLLIDRLVSFQHPEVINNCQKAFEDYLTKGIPIPADLRNAVYRTIAAQCDDNSWQSLMKLYQESTLQEEKNRIACSLGAVKKPEYIERVLEFAISDQVRAQDCVFVIISVAYNPLGREMAWEFFKNHKDFFINRYENGYLGGYLIKGLLENFQTFEMAEKAEEYFRANPIPIWERNIKQAIETIYLNAKLMKVDSESLRQFFSNNK